MEIDLSKQPTLNTDPKAIRKNNFTGNLDWAGNTTMIFINEEAKETIFHKKLSELCID